MRQTWFLAAAGAFVSTSLMGQGSDLGARYLDRLSAIWELDATRADVDALVALLAEDAVYEHPRMSMSVEGRRAIADAMSAFLGTTRAPQVSHVQVVSGSAVVVVAFDLTMDLRRDDAWGQVQRRQVVVLETSGGFVTRIADYW